MTHVFTVVWQFTRPDTAERSCFSMLLIFFQATFQKQILTPLNKIRKGQNFPSEMFEIHMKIIEALRRDVYDVTLESIFILGKI